MNRETLFYLGTHQPAWLKRVGVPMFLSRRTLCRLKKLPRALGRWALDSGGYSELNLFGKWTVGPAQYAAEVRRYRDEVGSLDWAAIQDWMCEPWVLQKTGLNMVEHQRRTVNSMVDLLSIAPDLPWRPVLQGWALSDYVRHAAMYEREGCDLKKCQAVGLGSVCRRQATGEAEEIVRTLTGAGYRLHGFGFKSNGLRKVWGVLQSADSLAWSFHARRRPPLPGHEARHINCANCDVYALDWREKLLAKCHGAVAA